MIFSILASDIPFIWHIFLLVVICTPCTSSNLISFRLKRTSKDIGDEVLFYSFFLRIERLLTWIRTFYFYFIFTFCLRLVTGKITWLRKAYLPMKRKKKHRPFFPTNDHAYTLYLPYRDFKVFFYNFQQFNQAFARS